MFEFVGSYSGKNNFYNIYKDGNKYFTTFLANSYPTKEELINNIKALEAGKKVA